MSVVIHETGAFDISLRELNLRDCFPGIGGRPVRPVRVTSDPSGKSVEYRLETGSIMIRFEENEESIILRTAVAGLPGSAAVSPVCAGLVSGADRIFGQGFGMASSLGLKKVSEIDRPALGWGIAAAGSEENGYLVFCAPDCTRYLTRFAFAAGKKPNPFYRDGGQIGQEQLLLSVDLMTEGFGGDLSLPGVEICFSRELDEGLKNAARRAAQVMHARPCREPIFHWCSWYYLYHNLDQALLENYAEGFRKCDLPFRFLQIDVGYCTTQGDWLKPSHHFPQGLKNAAETILSNGFEPGIWVGPFMVGDESDLAKEHPEWLLKNKDGSTFVQWRFYGEPKLWGQRDCDYYVLDTSHPDALQYITGVFRQLRAWGFRLFKTDFMLWGLHDSRQVCRFDPTRTGVEVFRATLKAIREAIGEDAVWLGCIAPFMPFIGFADAMRIGGDVGAQWKDHDFGPVNMIHEIISDHYFNGIWWSNDPDAVMLRDRHIYLTETEVQSLAILQGMNCGAVTTSDPVHEIGKERRELLEFIRPDKTRTARMWHFGRGEAVPVFVQDTAHGALIYAFNPNAEEKHITVDVDEAMGSAGWHVRERGGSALGRIGRYEGTVPRHGGKLLYVSKEPLDHEPENMWEW